MEKKTFGQIEIRVQTPCTMKLNNQREETLIPGDFIKINILELTKIQIEPIPGIKLKFGELYVSNIQTSNKKEK